ncbi:MAG: exodeoxyribonuclease VII small subunit [Candidatus Saccharimonadales bacterium]|jgi:exodeoxyribonuclease VII small subunit
MSTTNKSLSKQLAELDEIVAWFEQDDFDIEAAIAKFEAGSKLAEAIKAELATLENKITVLKDKFDSE